jgi:hypothetical protein
MRKEFERILSSGENELVRETYVAKWIQSLPKNGQILDVGAGNMPYRELITDQGIRYKSHDFEQYDGDRSFGGLQSEGWTTSGHDLVCDISKLPEKEFNYLICTEVLEHVPDPVEALCALAGALLPGGKLLITVPFASRMHQAPFWFSAGLSPYWFDYHLERNGLKIDELVVAGDFVDLMIQEVPLLMQPLNPRFRIGNGITKILKSKAKWLRGNLPRELLESGGQSVFCIATKL